MQSAYFKTKLLNGIEAKAEHQKLIKGEKLQKVLNFMKLRLNYSVKYDT